MSKLLLVASLSVLVVVLYLVLYFSFPEYEIKNNESYKFEAFKLHYNKDYTEDENSYRYSIFLGNLNYINEYNSLKTGVVLGINKFADLTKEEFDMTYKGYIA